MMDNTSWSFYRSREKSEELLKGAIDIHVHPGPHLISSPRSTDPVEAAIEAKEAGMRGIVYMDVFNMSVGTAWIVNQVVEGFTTYGGIILNTVYGGMNPRAVKTAVYYGSGARYVSFGSHSTCYTAYKEGRYEDGKWITLREKYPKFAEEELSRCIRIPQGKPGHELTEILEIIAANPQIYLVTGHVSNEEAFRLIELSKEFGIKKVVVSHIVMQDMSDVEMEKIAASGAYMEITGSFLPTAMIPKTHGYVEEEYRCVDKKGATKAGATGIDVQIKKLGAEHFIAVTDFGVYTLPRPVEGMREFIACMLDMGLSEEEVRTVTSTNPGRLLGLND